jgi:coproporphyrinogen III oxidase
MKSFRLVITSYRLRNRSANFIEKETDETHHPDTFLRESDGESNQNGGDGVSSIRGKFEKMIREAQDSVCDAIDPWIINFQ